MIINTAEITLNPLYKGETGCQNWLQLPIILGGGLFLSAWMTIYLKGMFTLTLKVCELKINF